MSISLFFRVILRFYFNYHHAESSSIYLHSAFTRRLQFAIRLVTTFLLSGYIGYGTPVQQYLGPTYMIANQGVLSIHETFGMTLANALHVTFVLAPLSVFLYIVQRLGLSYQDYIAGEILLLLSSFYISYKSQKLQSRKLALWFNSIFFVTIINQEPVRSTFIFELLASIILGMLVALLVSLLVFPLFATFDIENRVNFCLIHLNQMQTIVLHAFLRKDRMDARILLAQSAMVERRLRETMYGIRSRLLDARLEPSRLLQKLVNRKRQHIIDLTIDEQEDLITKLMFHVCSLQSMVKQCSFNYYHNNLIDELHLHVTEFLSCQSKVINAFVSPSTITRDEFLELLNNLHQAIESLNAAYKQVRLQFIQKVIETKIKTKSEDHLAHTFFFFQLNAIVRILAKASVMFPKSKSSKTKEKNKRNCIKNYFKIKFDRPRILSALKSTLIIGVGSIFVMIPRLADLYANGQWILFGLCMTQGDTVGGAFTTMKMRLIGTLLGSMCAYAIYKAVGEVVQQIFVLLIPWLLLFGYLKLIPTWDHTATIAASTPIVINLGRLYGDVYRQGNYVLLRIQEAIIGIGLGAILSILVFPIFAADLLKVNIQDTLKTCRHAIASIHSVYDEFFQHQPHFQRYSVNFEVTEELKHNIVRHRKYFIQLINSQRKLVDCASLEPSFWWLNYGFSSSKYKALVQQELDVFRMIHNMHATLVQMDEHSMNDKKQIEELRLNAAGGRFLPDLHEELDALGRQLSNCVDLWISYFTLTQTTYYRWSRIQCCGNKQKGKDKNKMKLIRGDLRKDQQSLVELHETVIRFQDEHQQALNRLNDFYIEKSERGEELSTFVPFAHSDQAESIFIAISAMHYSTIQLVKAALELGTTIHTIFELETTDVYRNF